MIELPDAVEVMTRTSVMALDPAAKTVTLSTKETVEYGTALIATGAMVRRLPVDGAHLEGIHYLRALANADSLIEDAERWRRRLRRRVLHRLRERGDADDAGQARHSAAAGGGADGARVRPEGRPSGCATCSRAMASRSSATSRSSASKGRGSASHASSWPAGARSTPSWSSPVLGVTPDIMLARKAWLEIGERGGVRADARLRAHGADGLYVAGDIRRVRQPRPMAAP